ncbi:MAG: hypothetical protein HWD58_11905 [Bacteroidota bacterium]|nr:MAG: hypothetical protein HWD58_11905 [Bacteroidota bacterium]
MPFHHSKALPQYYPSYVSLNLKRLFDKQQTLSKTKNRPKPVYKAQESILEEITNSDGKGVGADIAITKFFVCVISFWSCNICKSVAIN